MVAVILSEMRKPHGPSICGDLTQNIDDPDGISTAFAIPQYS